MATTLLSILGDNKGSIPLIEQTNTNTMDDTNVKPFNLYDALDKKGKIITRCGISVYDFTLRFFDEKKLTNRIVVCTLTCSYFSETFRFNLDGSFINGDTIHSFDLFMYYP